VWGRNPTDNALGNRYILRAIYSALLPVRRRRGRRDIVPLFPLSSIGASSFFYSVSSIAFFYSFFYVYTITTQVNFLLENLSCTGGLGISPTGGLGDSSPNTVSPNLYNSGHLFIVNFPLENLSTGGLGDLFPQLSLSYWAMPLGATPCLIKKKLQ